MHARGLIARFALIPLGLLVAALGLELLFRRTQADRLAVEAPSDGPFEAPAGRSGSTEVAGRHFDMSWRAVEDASPGHGK